jgi:hypothetical protein
MLTSPARARTTCHGSLENVPSDDRWRAAGFDEPLASEEETEDKHGQGEHGPVQASALPMPYEVSRRRSFQDARARQLRGQGTDPMYLDMVGVAVATLRV